MANPKTNIVPIRKDQLTPSANKFKFTQYRLDKTPCPAKGCKYYYDTAVTGLCLRVTSTGIKTYVLYRRVNGKPSRINLGRMRALTLAGARDAAHQLNGQLAAGVDVVKKRKESRKKHVTVGQLFTIWLNSAKARKLKTWQGDKRLWELHLKTRLSNREAICITTADVQKIADNMASKHPRTANKVTDLIRRIFNTAAKKGFFTGQNPSRFIDRQPEYSRERFLRPDEIPRFLAAVYQEGPPWRGYFLMLLYTGARRATVSSMRWQDIDMTDYVWHIPAWASKNGKSLCVPLVAEAIQVLNELLKTSTNGWVFPSDFSKSGHLETPTKPWRRICERADLKDLWIHDIRRTVGSWLAASGASNFVISKALGHICPRSAEVYARLDTTPVRNCLGEVTKGWRKP